MLLTKVCCVNSCYIYFRCWNYLKYWDGDKDKYDIIFDQILANTSMNQKIPEKYGLNNINRFRRGSII